MDWRRRDFESHCFKSGGGRRKNLNMLAHYFLSECVTLSHMTQGFARGRPDFFRARAACVQPRGSRCAFIHTNQNAKATARRDEVAASRRAAALVVCAEQGDCPKY
jgi:hypothetical protein